MSALPKTPLRRRVLTLITLVVTLATIGNTFRVYWNVTANDPFHLTWSDRKSARLTFGMTPDEVIAVMGPPSIMFESPTSPRWRYNIKNDAVIVYFRDGKLDDLNDESRHSKLSTHPFYATVPKRKPHPN